MGFYTAKYSFEPHANMLNIIRLLRKMRFKKSVNRLRDTIEGDRREVNGENRNVKGKSDKCVQRK